MITEQAIVTRCRGRFIELELQRQSACGRCELSLGCGTGAVARLLGQRKSLWLATELTLQAGDRIELGVSETAMVRASLLLYGLPLGAMLAAGLGAAMIPLSDALVALISFIGLAAGFLFARLVSRKLAVQLAPAMVKIEVNPQSLSGS